MNISAKKSALNMTLALLTIVCGTLILHTFSAWAQGRAAEFYSHALGGAHMDAPPQSAGFFALRLAYARALAERSPLLALPGTDPEELDAALTFMTTVRSEIAGIQSSPADSSLVTSGIYPLDFLTNLSHLEQLRLAFIASGTEADERRYEVAQLNTIDLYERDLTAYRAAFLNAVPQAEGTYGTSGITVSRDSVLQDLDALSSGVEQIREAIQRRNMCLSGIVSTCDAQALQIATLPSTPYTDTSSGLVAGAENMRSFFAQAIGEPALTRTPLIELDYPQCTADVGGAPLFSITTETISPLKIPYLHPWYWGDKQFIDAQTQQTLPFFKYFLDEGVRYIPNPPTTYYKCPVFDIDYANLFSTLDVSAFAVHEKLSRFASGTDAASMRSLEQALGSKEVIRERDALAYLSFAQKLANAGSLPVSDISQVVTLSLEIQDKSAHFDQVVYAIDNEDTTVRLLKRGVPVDLTPAYLFFVRSGFAALLLADDPSVTGGHGPLFVTHTEQAGQGPYVLYSSLIQTPPMTARLAHDLRIYTDIHANPDSAPRDPAL